MAVDPVSSFAEGMGKGIGEGIGEATVKTVFMHIGDVLSFFRRRSKSSLADLRPVHDALSKFSIGKAVGGAELGDMPETDQRGPWDYKRGGLNELFKDFFRARLLDTNADGAAATAIDEWRKLRPSSRVHYWRGRGQDFHLASPDVPEAKRHPKIKTLFPFVIFGTFEKPIFEDGSAMKPAALMVKMFVDAWTAFLDEKTRFDPRILLAVGNQAYIDGDFIVTGVDYTKNAENTIYKDGSLVLYRRLMITETMTKMLICLIGVPHVAAPADKLKAVSEYYERSEKLVGGIQILRDF
jgi:hypothetical protein